MPDRYQGAKPHADAATAGTAVDPGRVVRNKTLAAMDMLLYHADNHLAAGAADAAAGAVEAARTHLAEIDAVHAAAHAAFADAASRIPRPTPEVETFPDNPDPEPDPESPDDGDESGEDEHPDEPTRRKGKGKR